MKSTTGMPSEAMLISLKADISGVEKAVLELQHLAHGEQEIRLGKGLHGEKRKDQLVKMLLD